MSIKIRIENIFGNWEVVGTGRVFWGGWKSTVSW